MIEQYIQKIKEGIYPTRNDWFSKYGVHGNAYNELVEYKQNHCRQIDLFTQEKSLYYNADYITQILKTYHDRIIMNFEHLNYFLDRVEEVLVFSEVEGTLEIEGIKTSRKKIESTLQKDVITTPEERIIQNMKRGIEFIKNHEITEENTYQLYLILSMDSLKDDEQLEGSFYRMSDVDIIGYYGEVSDRGVDAKNLGDAMKQLVSFINEQLTNQSEISYLVPHIIHYYILYLHPYYDFNGRMARMLSYWYTLKCPFIEEKLPIFSEAINYNRKTKAQYYRSIESSRVDGNDLTYFLKTLFELGERFVSMYVQLYEIDQNTSKRMMNLTDNELSAIKTILLNIKYGDAFTWEQYHFMSKEQYSKQYTLKLMNGLVDKNVLELNKRGKINYYRMSM